MSEREETNLVLMIALGVAFVGMLLTWADNRRINKTMTCVPNGIIITDIRPEARP